MVSDRIALVRARNPSPMTLTGTNSYIVACGNGEAACIDPGPADVSHVAALQQRAAALGCTIRNIFVTHGHPDHAPAAAILKASTGAAVLAHPNAAFPHDRALRDGERLEFGETTFLVLDAPGHTFDHVVFYDVTHRALFTGDVVLGEGTVVIAPPNGAMRPYQRTLERLLRECGDAAVIYGGHGPPVADVRATLVSYIEHRRKREREVIDALREGPKTIPQLVSAIYQATPRALWPAAARQILAYLLALETEERVVSTSGMRAMTNDESSMLNPNWASIVGTEHAHVVEEELGAGLRIGDVRRYALINE